MKNLIGLTYFSIICGSFGSLFVFGLLNLNSLYKDWEGNFISGHYYMIPTLAAIGLLIVSIIGTIQYYKLVKKELQNGQSLVQSDTGT